MSNGVLFLIFVPDTCLTYSLLLCLKPVGRTSVYHMAGRAEMKCDDDYHGLLMCPWCIHRGLDVPKPAACRLTTACLHASCYVPWPLPWITIYRITWPQFDSTTVLVSCLSSRRLQKHGGHVGEDVPGRPRRQPTDIPQSATVYKVLQQPSQVRALWNGTLVQLYYLDQEKTVRQIV